MKGYKKGSTTPLVMTVANPSGTGNTLNFSGWDNLLKVEFANPHGNCLDDIIVKT